MNPPNNPMNTPTPKPIPANEIALTTPKGWGSETVIHNTAYCMKVLRFNPDTLSSFHLHLEKTETWYVESGVFYVTLIEQPSAIKMKYRLIPGDTLHLPAGTPHQLNCIEGGTIIEASTYHDDDDVVRIRPGDSQTEHVS
jgi:mannose-6-phosphate isomerase-like protein (cupin superfamily)